MLGFTKKTLLTLIIGPCFVFQCARAFHSAGPEQLCRSPPKSINTHRVPFHLSQGSNVLSRMNKPLYVSISTPDISPPTVPKKEENFFRRLSAISYIASMCVALPISLLPISLLSWAKVISKTEQEHLSLRAGELCSRGLLTIMPFVKMNIIPQQEDNPVPSIWCINHTSMLDVFILLAADNDLRGKNRRPIKFIYWKGLESNPVTKHLFQMCGFIPVQMADNGNGNPNEYDIKSFKFLLRELKRAFDEGFDVGMLPEGQLNPMPEAGLQPVFPGAHTLAKMSKRPIRMVGLHGIHRIWHPDDSLLEMKVDGEEVSVCAYPAFEHKFENSDEFVETFKAIVGKFGATGKNVSEEEMKEWLDGRAWEKMKEERTLTLTET